MKGFRVLRRRLREAWGLLRRNPVHYTLVFLEELERLPHLVALPIAVAVALGEARGAAVLFPWLSGVWWLWGGVQALGSLLDWLALVLLPRLGRSYGPVNPPLFALVVVRCVLSWVALGVGVLSPVFGGWVQGGLQVGLVLVVVYATYVEPHRLSITRLDLRSPAWQGDRPLRIVHVSDLHIERLTRRELRAIEAINAWEPDLILMTGDYLNLSFVGESRAIADARVVFSRLRARYGIFAVQGTPQVDPDPVAEELFKEGVPVRCLRDEHVVLDLAGGRVAMIGVTCRRDLEADRLGLRRAIAGVPRDAYKILLYHMPELLDEAEQAGVDLCLAGHTHGGQLRLPLYGAVVTATFSGKRYEMGLYRRNGTAMYVSRGLGMEGKAAPRARFLCPPEIVFLSLGADHEEG